jgi:hypothetical protein
MGNKRRGPSIHPGNDSPGSSHLHLLRQDSGRSACTVPMSMLVASTAALSVETQTPFVYTFVLHLADMVQTFAIAILPANPCNVGGLRVSSIDGIDSRILSIHAGGVPGGTRAASVTPNGIMPSACKDIKVTRLACCA